MRFRAFGARYRALWRRGAAAAERDAPGACAAVLRAVQAAAAPPAPASAAAVRWAIGSRHVFLSEGMRQVRTSPSAPRKPRVPYCTGSSASQVLERMRRARRQAAAECVQAAWRRHRASTHRPPLPAPSAARPRPAPIAGTPPPDPSDKCDPALVKRTCSLFGLDLVTFILPSL